MAAPVWSLSINLETKTATFTTGLNDAARNARGSFNEIRDAAGEMGRGVRDASGGVNYSMMEARHGVMMLGEEFGVHLPRGITTFITSLGPIGAAMEAAFPYLAIILGATLLIEHIVKIGEAEEKAAEAGRKMMDGVAENIAKVDLEINKAELEIRKLAGDPAWDLLNEKLRLEDAERGYQNVTKLEGELKKLLDAAPKTSNWNPLNWFDGSGDTQAKAKSLQEQMRGKSQTEQADTLRDAYTLQSHILEQLKGQNTASSAELTNQQKYVDFLRQESELLQKQVDAAALADQAQQGKDRAERIKRAEEEEAKLAETRERGFDHRQKVEAEYAKKQKDAHKKEVEDEERMAAEKMAADAAYYKWVGDQEAKRAHLGEELGRENARHSAEMGKLEMESNLEQGKLAVTIKRNRAEQMLEVALAAEQREYEIRQRAFEMEIAALDKNGRDYDLKLTQLNNREAELTRAHENNITGIKNRAMQERNMRILAGERQLDDGIARGLASVVMRHQSFAAAMASIGDQVLSGMIQNAIMSMIALDMTKEKDAAAAARMAFLAGWHFPFPTNIVMAPALGALAFASAMAFEEGGIVPGVEKGDVVPARLTPGEGVIPKQLMENLTNAARSGNVNGGGDVHMHHHAVYNVQAFDSTGVDKVLRQHGEKFSRHFERELRRRNL